VDDSTPQQIPRGPRWMRRWLPIVVIGALFFALMGGRDALRGLPPPPPPQVDAGGGAALDIGFIDGAGRTRKLSDYKGQIVV
jgi:hypothetical protein